MDYARRIIDTDIAVISNLYDTHLFIYLVFLFSHALFSINTFLSRYLISGYFVTFTKDLYAEVRIIVEIIKELEYILSGKVILCGFVVNISMLPNWGCD